jgi:hypothetical protein
MSWGSYQVLAQKSKLRRPLEIFKGSFEDNIKMAVHILCESVEWTKLTQHNLVVSLAKRVIQLKGPDYNVL